MNEKETRAKIVAEALSWIGTPYHLGGRRKGISCDCATLILSVMVNAGIFDDQRLGQYKQDWWCHATDEKYLVAVLRHAKKILEQICYRSSEIEPGNIVLVKTAGSRVANHAAIITCYPRAVHAIMPKVTICDVTSDRLWAYRPIQIFDPLQAPEASC
jgi:cell wall-associated NlpC family hydrolase